MSVSQTPFELFNKAGVETRKRQFKFNLNALADFEQEVGSGLPQMLGTRSVFASTRGLMWAGLKWQDRTLTLDRVGDLIQEFLNKGGKVDECLSAALQAASEQGAIGKLTEDKDESDDSGNAPATAPSTPTE